MTKNSHKTEYKDAMGKRDVSRRILSARYRDRNADIEIISSNNIVFKVHTSMLRAISLTRRLSLPLYPPDGGYPPIKLENDDIGNSIVLTMLLDLSSPKKRVRLNDGLLNRRVIRLARYWKCRSVLVRIAKEILLLSASTTQNPEPALFITAVGLEDPRLLGEIVARTGYRRWSSKWCNMDYVPGGLAGSDKEHSRIMNPTYHYDFGCWSLDQYFSIPPFVIKAMEIARTAGAWSGQVDWDRVGRELVSLLYKAHGPSNNWTDSTWPPKLYLPQPKKVDARSQHSNQGSSNGIEDKFQERWWTQDPPCKPPNNDGTISSQKHNDTDANMVMKSSDGLPFRVNSAVLSKASSVFESMLSMDQNYLQGSPMQLGDELKDHSIIYDGALMDVLYPTPHTRLLDLHKINVILYLIDLAELWSIEKVYRVIVEDIKYEQSYRNFDLFLIAIKLKYYTLAASMIERDDQDNNFSRLGSDIFPPLQIYGSSAIGSIKPFKPKEAPVISREDNPKRRCFRPEVTQTKLYDIKSCEYLDFIQLPPPVAWALQRATLMWDHGLTDPSVLLSSSGASERIQQRKKGIAENFKRIMIPNYHAMATPGS